MFGRLGSSATVLSTISPWLEVSVSAPPSTTRWLSRISLLALRLASPVTVMSTASAMFSAPRRTSMMVAAALTGPVRFRSPSATVSCNGPPRATVPSVSAWVE